MSKSHRRTIKKTANKLKRINSYRLRCELKRRGEPYAFVECDCETSGRFHDFDKRAAQTAQHYLSQGDLREASIWIARAWPDFDRLEQLIARVLPTAGV